MAWEKFPKVFGVLQWKLFRKICVIENGIFPGNVFGSNF
jgi:hypothetical protein